MEAVPIKLGRSDLEVRLTDAALTKAGIEVDDDDADEWYPILASYLDKGKVHFIVGVPWLPESGEPMGEEETWFIPTSITEKDVDAMRFRTIRND